MKKLLISILSVITLFSCTSIFAMNGALEYDPAIVNESIPSTEQARQLELKKERLIENSMKPAKRATTWSHLPEHLQFISK